MKALAANWWALALRGLAGILFGGLTLFFPGLSLAALVLLFGAYAAVDGIFAVVAAVRGRGADRPWWALVLGGLISLAAGVAAFVYPRLTALTLVYLIGAWALVHGVFEIVAAVRLRKQIRGEAWLALSGVLSVVFGALVLVAPGAGALALLLWIGAYAVVFGVLLIALAFRIRGWAAEERQPLTRAA
jgi:uncharacterized membrane protein HdeD (DUF308 family)